MKPARLLRWYPRAWRERYGEELLTLIQDTLGAASVNTRLRIPRAVRKGRRLRAATSGATVVNPSAQRTHGRHRA